MPLTFTSDEVQADKEYYKDRNGKDTGHRPNTKPPEFGAGDDPKVGNPGKEAGKGGRLRHVDRSKYITSGLWDQIGPEARRLKLTGGAFLRDKEGNIHMVLVRCEDGSTTIRSLMTNPIFCSKCLITLKHDGLRDELDDDVICRMHYLGTSSTLKEPLPDRCFCKNPKCFGDKRAHALVRDGMAEFGPVKDGIPSLIAIQKED